MRILVLNGPNLARLGKREPEIYGRKTLDDVVDDLSRQGAALGVAIEARQSNHEGDLVDWIGAAGDDGFVGVLLNPGAYTHTSYALYDAIRASEVPVVEVHISNPEARETFRAQSLVAPACLGKVAGFGTASYGVALGALVEHLRQSEA